MFSQNINSLSFYFSFISQKSPLLRDKIECNLFATANVFIKGTLSLPGLFV